MSTDAHHTGNIPQVTLGVRLQMALRHAHMSVQGMADELGMSRSNVSRWLNDHAPEPPRDAYLKLWALRTGVPYEWLKDGAVPTTKSPGPGVTQDRGSKLPRQDSILQPSDYRLTALAA